MRIAVISLVLDEPKKVQKEVNEVISSYKDIIRGRMGIPLDRENVSIISIAVIGEADTINAFTGRLGKIDHVQVKTSFSKKQ
ncbi:TM1266 family iron-only hydrogenase system putative regulator [Anaerofustis sp. NSJ-163]|uniref:TM1266 family iron-only hydrogenase system putative regulator n=1 Tax=Anaerofustis sp. NSJ-163 TaxID=2944391 RepID=UPI00209C1BBB|nr:TM1266 family iron-only hydrogenase system putative regulator [Anaerofustis sp. NSJ-163]MCO8194707.1 iron-only hydrogenase system regulator [Anaerofustis sp. NSJ-163]